MIRPQLRKPDGNARLSEPVFRPKDCKECKTRFKPTRAFQPVCYEMACMVAYAEKIISAKRIKEKAAKLKQDRALFKVRKEKLKTRSEYIKEAQVAFNAFVRARDAGKPCICCGHPLRAGDVGGAYDCGHYRSVGSAPHLRFDERNAHAQRKQCNRYGAGRAVDYRIGLIARIGAAAVDELEADQQPRHWSVDDIKAIRDDYRRKTRELMR